MTNKISYYSVVIVMLTTSFVTEAFVVVKNQSITATVMEPLKRRAVTIDIVSDGRAIDALAIKKARKLSGDALAVGTIDLFIVNSPKIGGSIMDEGGMSACAEIGFNAKTIQFNAFVKKLRAIPKKTGTFVNIIPKVSCFKTKVPNALMCGGIANISCPIGQVCIDDRNDVCDPKNGGADCAGVCQ